MADAVDPGPASHSAATQPSHDVGVPLKRTKVRKGTRSCWECKRRKIRCMFASPGDAVCIGCQHRLVPCVSQELPEPASPVKRVRRRLGERVVPASVDDQAGVPPYRTTRETCRRLAPSRALLTPGSQDVLEEDLDVASDEAETGTARRHLLAALPAAEDVRILHRESARPSRYTLLINTQSHSRQTLETLSAPYPTPTDSLPLRHDSHPVLLARLMLTFAITLQSPAGAEARGLSEPPDVIMRRLAGVAKTWVTTKEDMYGSLEGLACIVLEGVYEINGGNLRRAWAVFRRAMTVAQLMGLHRAPIPPLQRIDPQLDLDPEFMWFRIVYLDRYLSLLLGLPQGTADTRMGAETVWRLEPPLGRFERRLTVVASRILQRNEGPLSPSQLPTTQAIDAELLEIARSMPAGFWRAPSFLDLKPGSPEAFLETTRLTAHVYYHGLLIQLHLPYTMRTGDDLWALQEYSKATCVHASREIIRHFIAHRSFNPSSACSRPVDFFALLAAMTLLLAHIDAHHHPGATNLLAHLRLGDRAMLDQALERMDAISGINKDVVTGKSAQLIRQLLHIEADAAEGNSYTTTRVMPDRRGGDGGSMEGDGRREPRDGLVLDIPYLGSIKICRQGLASAGHDLALESQLGLPPIAAGIDDWAFQGVDMAFFDGLMRGTACPEAVGLQP